MYINIINIIISINYLNFTEKSLCRSVHKVIITTMTYYFVSWRIFSRFGNMTAYHINMVVLNKLYMTRLSL